MLHIVVSEVNLSEEEKFPISFRKFPLWHQIKCHPIVRCIDFNFQSKSVDSSFSYPMRLRIGGNRCREGLKDRNGQVGNVNR